MKKLNGGTFNLLYGRNKATVKSEVERLLVKHDLDFLCVQEATDYYKVLNEIEGYKYFATTTYRGGKESGILVKESIPARNAVYGSFGDGWITIRGGKHAAPTFPRVSVDWLRVGSIHTPTPSKWVNGKLVAPKERYDDYMALAKRAYRFFKLFPRRAAVIAGDWNESPSTMGEWSPGWIAKKAGAKVIAPSSTAGHGRIDYPIFKNVQVVGVRKDLAITEGSDHEPVIFTVIKR